MATTRNRSRARVTPTARRSGGWNNRLALVGASFLVSANLCLFGPFEIFTSNRAEFKLTLGDMLPVLIGFCVLLTAILALLGFLIPKRNRHRVTAVLLATGVLLWIQGSFLRWGYGEFTGVPIDWAAFTWRGWIDAAMWSLGLIGAFYFSKRLSRSAFFVATVFVLIQFGAMAARTIAKPDESPKQAEEGLRKKNGPSDMIPDALCQVSTSSNVFHIILDAFQTDVFVELVEEDVLSEMLDGFVAYPENISTGSRTVLSVPAVFSAKVYDGTKVESEYFRTAMDESVPSLLHRNGYIVNLLPHVAMLRASYTNYFTRSDSYAARRWIRLTRASTYLVDVGMFRQFPHFAKRAVYNNQNWRLSAVIGDPPSHASFHHKAMFRDYMNRLEAVHRGPAYHFVHLMPPHPPFVTLADGSYAGEALPHTRENYKNEARYILRSFMDFLQKLKDLDIYDSSVILLHGDHGTGLTPQSDASEKRRRLSWVSAMLLLKPAGAHGALEFSSAQTSLADIPVTLSELLGVSHSYPGESIVKLDPSLNRKRHVVFVTDRTTSEPVIHEWVVNGIARDSTSWHELSPRKVDRQIGRYEWGKLVGFGISNTGESYLTSGWSTTAATYSWNNGQSATLTMGVEQPDRDVVVTLVFFPYIVPGKLDQQRIRISINGVLGGEITCVSPEATAVRQRVPRDLLKDGRMVVSFVFHDAVSPSSIGDGSESRVLAIKLYGFDAKLVPQGTPDPR